MSHQEVEQIAQRVAEILSNRSDEVAPQINVGQSAKPLAPIVNDDLIREVASGCMDLIMQKLHSDEEQFMCVSKLREYAGQYWDKQFSESRSIARINDNRAEVLGKFIEMTIPR